MIRPVRRSLALVSLVLVVSGCVPRSGGASIGAVAPSPLRQVRAHILRAEDRRVVDAPLLAALEHEAPEIRAAALRALGRIGDPGAVAPLVAALGDESEAAAAAAARSLGWLAAAEGLPALVRASSESRPAVRAVAVEALARFGGTEADAAIAARLADEDDRVVTSAAWVAGDLGGPSVDLAERLVEIARGTQDEPALAASYALSRISARQTGVALAAKQRARAFMLELARSPLPGLRRWAALGLFVPTSDEEAATAGRMIEDSDPSVRVAAIQALTFPGAPIRPFLIKAFSDADDRVVLAAVDGLGRMLGEDVIELLARFVIYDKRPWLRERAVLTLGRASAQAVPVAGGLARDQEAWLRRATAAILVGRVDAASEETVRRLASDPDPDVRAASLPALAEIPGPLVALLGESLESDDPAVRAAIAATAGARLKRAELDTEGRLEAWELLARLADEAGAAGDTQLRLAVLDAAAGGGAAPEARGLLERALESTDVRVRQAAADHLAATFGEDRREAVGPLTDLGLDEYIRIAAWAERPRAAIVTVERPGFQPARFTLLLDTAETPLSAWRFASLAAAGFFDGKRFDRPGSGASVVAGDARGPLFDDPGSWGRDEWRASRIWPGTLAWAGAARDRLDGRFSVSLVPMPASQRTLTAFGQVVQNLPGVVGLLLPWDRVVSVRVYEGDGNEPLPPLE